MRYIGNKENLVANIYQILQERNIAGKSFFDVFSGTANVGKFFKKLGYQIYANDLMYYSYVLQQCYLKNNTEPNFDKLLNHIEIKSDDLFATPLQLTLSYLNNIPNHQGFIANNYTPQFTQHLDIPRMYFSNENGLFIDKVRNQIELWKNDDLINENEYYILIASLIETVPFYANISGVFGAFHKTWDKRALKSMYLRQPEIIINDCENFVFNTNSKELMNIQADIYYLDPPYNQRQYAPNYHLLETIAKYDNPVIKGVSGMRDYSEQKSKFCQVNYALNELDYMVNNGDYRYFVLSYNNEGIMKSDEILEILKPLGDVELVEFDYLRFKSNSNGDSRHKKYIKEQLYILSK